MQAKRYFPLLFSLLLAIILAGITNHAYSQLSKGGIPYSFIYNFPKQSPPLVNVQPPDLLKLSSEDGISNKNGNPYRYAVNLPLNLDFFTKAQMENLPNGDHLFRLSLRCKGALALSCFFDDFYLPSSASLFLYSNDNKQLIGSFTSDNNQDNRLFATELLHGDEITLEYFEPAYVQGLATIHLSELSFAYRGFTFRTTENTYGFGSSEACEVNINCSEGQSWQNQKRAVVRIAVKIGSSSYWCTGTLLNNVNQDYKPYLLTADHCGSTANTTDLSQWVFYFNYEGLDCSDPILEPGAKTLTGAQKRASSGGGGTQIKESDLYLVLLNNLIPDNYNVFYAGWNRLNSTSSQGVSIHHPEGDIKKISTYLTSTVSSSWGSTPGSHWSVKWAATQHGHGVTEPGSSGSPLFNAQGEVVGQLSGGESSCSNLTASDLYGKFSYSWQPLGSDSSTSLHYWLDPSNTGPINLPGLAPNFVYVVANFMADKDTFVVGNTVNFNDLSTGDPYDWKWTFAGGEPSTSTVQHPKDIAYNKAGVFSVTMIATNHSTSDTIEKRQYITVLPHIYPVPANDHFTIDLGTLSSDGLEAEMYDMLGRKVSFLLKEENPGHLYSVYITNAVSGVYYLKMKTSSLNLSRKITFIKTPKH